MTLNGFASVNLHHQDESVLILRSKYKNCPLENSLSISHNASKSLGLGGGGQLVSVLAFYSDNLNSNLAKAYNFSATLFLKRMKINTKRPGLVHLKTIHRPMEQIQAI